jgi:hypothetical protein
MYLGDLLLIQNTLFDLKIDMAKKKMTLTEIKEGLLPLKLSSIPERLSLYTADGSHILMGYKLSGEVIKLPAGSYKLLEYQLLRNDGQGDLWKINAMGTNNFSPVAVSSTDTRALAFGEPFTPVIIFPSGGNPFSPGAGSLPLSFRIEGKSKEIVNGLTRFEGTGAKIPLSTKKGLENRPLEPSYTIVKTSGEIVAKGSFEYG